MGELKDHQCREDQTHQAFHRPATAAYRQNVSVATLVLRWSNKQQEMWVVLTRNGFRFCVQNQLRFLFYADCTAQNVHQQSTILPADFVNNKSPRNILISRDTFCSTFNSAYLATSQKLSIISSQSRLV